MKNFLTLLLVALPLCGYARECETLQYATNGSNPLYLDHYRADSIEGLRPCVIFVFPGGFMMGSKADKRFLDFFDFLCHEGYDVVSIDYRLGFSKVYNYYGWKKGYLGQLQRLKTTIRWATEDLLSATAFVLKQAASWNINPKQIIACGSSAGAVTCLQAEYVLCSKDTLARRVPRDFNYAGVVSYAGAVFSSKGAPKWRKKPCPILMFHGSSDGNVPYRKAELFGIGLYGSAYIAEQLEKRGAPYTFYDADHRTHEMAILPTDENRAELMEFLRPTMYQQKTKDGYNTRTPNQSPVPSLTLQLHKHIHDRSIPKRSTKFSIKDYIRNNFGGGGKRKR